MNSASARLHNPKDTNPLHSCPERIYALDGGHVVIIDSAAAPACARRIAQLLPERHITLVVCAENSIDAADVGLAAAACARLVIYESSPPDAKPGEQAAFLARFARSTARTECGIILDGSRALRHCVDGMRQGHVIVYGCHEPQRAAEILREYGAHAVSRIVGPRRAQSPRAKAGAGRAPSRRLAAIAGGL